MPTPDSNRPSASPQGVDSYSDRSPESGVVLPTSSAPAKRTRVLLSCHPCRASKLKCNRLTPCGQCLKRGKSDACVYAPKVEKSKPARTMAARLKRLEGMVRGMVEPGGGDDANRGQPAQSEQGASVVYNEKATNYVGGTHFAAILEDLEDLKTYFEDPDDSDLDDWVVTLGGVFDPFKRRPVREPRAKRIAHAVKGRSPEQGRLDSTATEQGCDGQVDESLFQRKQSLSTCVGLHHIHIIHIPTFTKQYNEFLQDRQAADFHWIAMLFMVLALGIYFSSFGSPHELEFDTSIPAMDRFRQYRGAAGCALIQGKYSHPGPFTLQAMCLYLEGDFLANRVSQLNCYLLCATIIRLMLKAGLHRDPDKLPCITLYEGEMRRRMWNYVVQIDLMVSFHLGLPCMIHGIESDTALPRNLLDSDFDEDSTSLPPSRGNDDYTPLSYPINKMKVTRGFGLVARLSHALTLPTYAEIMRVDACIQDAWSSVPSFLRIKPLSESVTDPPMLVIQRFGLASLYQKARCVLHRRYLVDPRRLKEHDYSRRTCLEASVSLLSYQSIMADATKPGALLAANRWFIASLAINDFLLADMVVALAVQQDSEFEDGTDWMATCTPPITKDYLIKMLERSFMVWKELAVTVADCRKATSVVRTMLEKIYAQKRKPADLPGDESVATGSTNSYDEQTSSSMMADMNLGGLGGDVSWAYHPANEYSGIDNGNSHSRDNNMGASFANFGMLDPRLAGHDDSSRVGAQPADPWGHGSGGGGSVPQMQGGYDWVSERAHFSLDLFSFPVSCLFRI
ncbi:hypothetical protein NPX13_g4374 [Xylaria arbuscula]|uniref:Zn(2)-C6 fungal-type domain-containing protein n=1 Tax=Xylaria arbuscula TaxID=114810 RepID=A0A9W8NFZ9_9PEZI|nr:hypothetical protein NPX13_g4374 [Xylaria arbuscula]